MPLYEFKNKNTGEIEEHLISIKDLDTFKEDNQHLQKMIAAPRVDTSPAFPTKPPEGFRKVLRNMAKGHKDSTINSF